MKTTPTIISAAFALCALAACSTSSVNVVTDYDHTANFGKYRTYALANATHGQTLSPSSETALRESLRSELGKRGLTEASGKKADLDVVRHVFIQDKVDVQQYTDWGYGFQGGWPYGYGYYGMWTGGPISYMDVNQYREGTMILDFVDARTKKLVFRATGTAVVGGPESNAAKIRAGVAKMVAEFPAGS